MLTPESLPTHGGPAGPNVMAIAPEIDAVVAEYDPVPEIVHVANSAIGMLPAATVNAVDVSWAPETVPLSVPLTVMNEPSLSSSSTLRTRGPETFAPLCVAVHVSAIPSASFSPLNFPVQVPARFRPVAGAGEEGEVGDDELSPEPQAEIETTQTLRSNVTTQLERMEPPFFDRLDSD